MRLNVKKKLYYNIVCYDVLIIMIYAVAGIAFFFAFNTFIGLFTIIPIVLESKRLVKNIQNIPLVIEKTENGIILYESSNVILTDKSLISLKRYIFSIDYLNINDIYISNEYFIYEHAQNLCLLSNENKKYKIVYIYTLYSLLTYKHEIKQILEIIKTYNKNIELYGKIKEIYEKNSNGSRKMMIVVH